MNNWYPNRPGMGKTPEQLRMELTNSIQQQQEMLNRLQGFTAPYQTTGQSTTVPRRSGSYYEVEDVHEVEDAPTPLDGTPCLFYNFKNHIFWSKKYVNGGHLIQAYHFEPIMGVPSLNETPEVNYIEELEKPTSNDDTINQILAMLTQLVNKENSDGTNGSNQNGECHIESESSSGSSSKSVSKEVSRNGGNARRNDQAG